MVAAGIAGVFLLSSEGQVTLCRPENGGEVHYIPVPAVGEGEHYLQVAVGTYHVVLLKSNGSAVAWKPRLTTAVGPRSAVDYMADEYNRMCNIPTVERGQVYVQVAAGGYHTVLLKSDGSAVTCGGNDTGQCDIPALTDGLIYTQVAAGSFHTVLLRSDGAVAWFGHGIDSRAWPGIRIDAPSGGIWRPPDGSAYVAVAAGDSRTCLFTDAGSVRLFTSQCPERGHLEFLLPDRIANLGYTCACMSWDKVWMVTAEGLCVRMDNLWGHGEQGRMDILRPPEGMAYVHVSCSSLEALLLRSDGNVEHFDGPFGAVLRDVSVLPTGVTYVASVPSTLLVQATLQGDNLKCLALTGEELCHYAVDLAARVADARLLLAAKVRECRALPLACRIEAILPGGVRLNTVSGDQTLATAFDIRRRRVRGKKACNTLYRS